MTQVSLIISPQFTFAELSRKMPALGWSRCANGPAEPPLVPGEPEFASWTRNREGSVSYTFNPVVRLRVLVFHGPRAVEQSAEAEGALPTIGLADMRDLLQSPNARQILLGIFAAREQKALSILDLLAPLCNHFEAAVARAAQKTHAELLGFAVEVGVDRLREIKRQHPERSILFPRVGDAHMRRQTLRWLIRDYRAPNQHIAAVLRSGFVDEDWEVRATAMLAAVRFRATELGGEIRCLELPETSRNGPDEADRTILFAARRIALECLAQAPEELQMSLNQVPAGEDDQASKATVLRHLRRCMLGLPITQYDRIFLLINALTEPVEVEGLLPPVSPAIVAADQNYKFVRFGLDLCWVPPIAHWLGTDDRDLAVLNPIRPFAPDQGYFIARRSIDASTVAAIRSGATNSARNNGDEAQKPFLCDREEAVRLCHRLGEMEGTEVLLPTADQWEAASRGTDGRRYPWGNGREKLLADFESPWGINPISPGRPEWTSTLGGGTGEVVCVGGVDGRCAFRESVADTDPRAQCAVRPVVLPSNRA